ncbi:MarR family transcriptional regulator [Alsobacter metallidurans]|uniref:MarR family transcriptional regulator n=1 Tax=Alsobacter metallidurans TaxID=340221 RepID=A0A917I591_9HYPH|nr:MarR family transcriptional regulator [Alsobacter metallidurans]GGH12553.1 MarR family transcriptional regulator [Alsobacter metallidurans]
MPHAHKDQDTPELLLENQLCFAVYSAAHAFTAAYKPLLDQIGVTYPQYLVLLVLWEADGSSVGEIGGKLNLDSGTLTPLLKRLETQGFISRNRDKNDERVVRVSLTSLGRDARIHAVAARRAIVCSLEKTEPEIHKLKALVTELDDRLRTSAPNR